MAASLAEKNNILGGGAWKKYVARQGVHTSGTIAQKKNAIFAATADRNGTPK